MSDAYRESFDLLKPWRDSANALPAEVRKHHTALEIGTRLQHLHFERERLKQAYDSSLAKIRSHEKNLIRSLRELAPTHSAGGDQP